MPSVKSLSFRQSAAGEINELLDDEGLDCKKTLNLLAYAAGALLDLKNEGMILNSNILFCQSVDGLAQQFPSALRISVGHLEFNENSASIILKSCAYMTSRSWHIFIERTSASDLFFGLISFADAPGAVGLEDLVRLVNDQVVFLIRRISPSATRILTNKGNIINFSFSTGKEHLIGAEEAVNRFCRSFDFFKEGTIDDRFSSYFSDFVKDCIESCHGTILVILEGGASRSALLKDCIRCSPELDIEKAFQRYAREQSSSALLALQRTEMLIRGIFQGDGMIAFHSSGKLAAFKVFYKPKSEKNVEGGARRRAFEALQPMIGKTVRASLFRSQDGLTLIKDKANASD